MRTLLLALGLAALSTTASAFLSPISPERPVSQRLFGAPAGNQQTLAVASNGTIGFAIWLDGRRGSYQTDLYGARIDLSGVSLDPMGILIGTKVSNGTVIWNGSAFVVISEGNSLGTTFTYITPDGVQIDQKSIRINQNFAATMGSGPDARILFASYGTATVVDVGARILASDVRYGTSTSFLVAGSNKSEFLVLHGGDITNRLYAERFDRDGKLISTKDTGVDSSIIGTVLALTGTDDDYLLAGRGPTGREIVTVHLSPNGVAKGALSQQAASSSTDLVTYPPARPAIVVDGDVYVLAWTRSTANGEAYTTILELPATDDGVVTIPLVRPLGWTGTGYGSVLGLAGTRVILISDAFRAGVSTSIDPIATVLESPYGKSLLPFSLSTSATQQATPQVATSTGGYAVVWNEYGPDGATHLYLRRFLPAPTGAPIDAAPIEVASDASGKAITARIAAAGDTYVVAWSTFDTYEISNYVVRRLSATTGSWIDPEPVRLAAHTFELALGASSNGVLAVYSVTCPSGRCMHARAIAIDSGEPLPTPESPSLAPIATDISIGSNGTEFLVVWTPNTCFGGPQCDIIYQYELFAQRLGADGIPLDPKPLTLDNDYFLRWPSIAWSGEAYVVTWADLSPGTIRASRLTTNGGLTEVQHVKQVLRPDLYWAQRLVASGKGLFLLTKRSDVIEGVTLDPQSLLASGPVATLAIDRLLNESFAAAASPDGLVIAYDRIDAGSGNVDRVVSRVFGNAVRHRSVR